MVTSTLAPVALAAALAITGFQPPAASLSEAQKTEMTEEAKAVTQAMAAAIERLDVDAATKDFLLGPASLVVGSDGEVADPTSYREGVRAFYASLSRLHFTTSREEFRVLAPDLILYVWSYKVEGTSKRGGEWLIDSETASFLLRKVDGAWKFVFFQESAAPPRPVAAPAAARDGRT